MEAGPLLHWWNSRHILIVNDLLKRESRRLPTNKATQDQPRVANLPDPQLAYVCLFVCLGVVIAVNWPHSLSQTLGIQTGIGEYSRMGLHTDLSSTFVFLEFWSGPGSMSQVYKATLMRLTGRGLLGGSNNLSLGGWEGEVSHKNPLCQL